jgi:hypothetical protein
LRTLHFRAFLSFGPFFRTFPRCLCCLFRFSWFSATTAAKNATHYSNLDMQ